MKKLALEMFESIVIPLYQSDFMLKDWISWVVMDDGFEHLK